MNLRSLWVKVKEIRCEENSVLGLLVFRLEQRLSHAGGVYQVLQLGQFRGQVGSAGVRSIYAERQKSEGELKKVLPWFSVSHGNESPNEFLQSIDPLRL